MQSCYEEEVKEGAEGSGFIAKSKDVFEELQPPSVRVRALTKTYAQWLIE